MAAGDDLQSKAAELVKKVLTVGVGAAFLTEESLRGMVNELKLPKELIGGLLDSAGKTKNEFFQKLSSEIIERVSSRLDPQALVSEFLQKNEVEFTVKVNVKPKGKAAKTAPGSGDDE
jgi:hypothetical protein